MTPESKRHSELMAAIRTRINTTTLAEYNAAGFDPGDDAERAAALSALSELEEQLEALVAVADSMSVLLADTIYQPKDYTGPEVWWAVKTRDLLARYDALSNPASGEQTLREPSRSGGLRSESLPPESSPASRLGA